MLLAGLLLLLVALFAVRALTRRPDPSRVPRGLDVLVIHVAGLRADAAPTDTLAVDLGLPPAEVLSFSEAFAPSGDARRSVLSVLEGDLVLNLDARPGGGSLAAAMGTAGWTTLLVGQGELPAGASASFAETARVAEPGGAAAELERLLRGAPPGQPALAFVHLGGDVVPLHAETTDASALRSRYAARVADLRSAFADLARAAAARGRPGLVVLAGASGLELGDHPLRPDLPWDSHLRVPMLIGLRGATGLPGGRHEALVQTTDLAPTLLDLLDLRDPGPRSGDGADRTGVSLEALVHGWSRPPVHESVFFADRHSAAARSRAWKLIAEVEAPWRILDGSCLLFAVEEDPRESRDLLEGGKPGPAAAGLLAALRRQLERPEPGNRR